MKILVTRPKEDGEETARLLAARGHEALLAPLLRTAFHDGPMLGLAGVQAVLATSANGVRALARRTARRDVALFAVGPQTAEAAAAAGFAEVRNADGDAMTLARAAAEWARPEKGTLLHIRGQDSAGSLAARLRETGFMVNEEILYAIEPLSLPAPAAAALNQGELDAALFFSPRSAGIFRDQILQSALPVARLIAVSISAATDAALTPLAFAARRIALLPNQQAVLVRLEDGGSEVA